MKNIITIDPSITSTAMVVKTDSNMEIFNYTSENTAMTKKGNLQKWHRVCEPEVSFRFFDMSEINKKLEYSELESVKYHCYKNVADKIIEDINSFKLDPLQTEVYVEGYSYSSSAGPLIDLVTFGTLLRNNIKKQYNLNVISPSSLKRYAAEITYEPIQKGKKIEYRNKDGIAGGSFKKGEMLQCIYDCEKMGSRWKDFLKSMESDLKEKKNVPKPIDDINDAYIMAEWVNHRLSE